jgi:outer membrane protein TolC
MKRITIATIIIILSNNWLSAAETGANSLKIIIDQGKPPTSEVDFVNMALERNQKLKALHTNVAIADLKARAAQFPNPELRIRDLSARNYYKDFDELKIGVRFRLPELGESRLERQDAKVKLSEEQYEAWQYRQELIRTVRLEFLEVYYYDQLCELAEKRVELENQRLATIENMVNIGQRSIVYYTKARLRHADSQQALFLAIQNQLTARQKLARRANLEVDQAILEPSYPEIKASVEELVALAFKQRPELQLVEQRLQLSNIINRYEKWRTVPWFNFIELNYHVEANQQADWGELAMGIEFPLFDWNRANKKAARLALSKMDFQLAAMKEQIETQVRKAYQKYANLLIDYQEFMRQTETLIRETRNIIEEAKRHRTLPADEVYEMELAIIDLNKLLIEKKFKLAEAWLELYLTIGIVDRI